MLEEVLGMLEDWLGELDEGLGMLGDDEELGVLGELGILGMEDEDEEELEVDWQPVNIMADKPSMIRVDVLLIVFISAFVAIISVLL